MLASRIASLSQSRFGRCSSRPLLVSSHSGIIPLLSLSSPANHLALNLKQQLQKRFIYTLEPLNYTIANGLLPAFSPRALKLHFDEHFRGHLKKANNLLYRTEFEFEPIETTIRSTYGDPNFAAMYNHVSAFYNHRFFFEGMYPGGKPPSAEMEKILVTHFESLTNLKKKLADLALAIAGNGNGWLWLVVDGKGNLDIVPTFNSGSIYTVEGRKNLTPLLCVDLWEHSYYIDHQNRVDDYVYSWFRVINWEFAAKNLARAQLREDV